MALIEVRVAFNCAAFIGRAIVFADLAPSRASPAPTGILVYLWEPGLPAMRPVDSILISGLERTDKDRRVDPCFVEADVPVQVRPGRSAG